MKRTLFRKAPALLLALLTVLALTAALLPVTASADNIGFVVNMTSNYFSEASMGYDSIDEFVQTNDGTIIIPEYYLYAKGYKVWDCKVKFYFDYKVLANDIEGSRVGGEHSAPTLFQDIVDTGSIHSFPYVDLDDNGRAWIGDEYYDGEADAFKGNDPIRLLRGRFILKDKSVQKVDIELYVETLILYKSGSDPKKESNLVYIVKDGKVNKSNASIAKIDATSYPDGADMIALGVVDKINALPKPENVKASDKAAIEAARAAYDKLTDAQKAKIGASALQKLKDDETALKKAIADEADAKAAQAVVDMINALPKPENVKTSDKAAIVAARAAYDKLTDAQKNKVPSDVYKKLTDDEAALAELSAGKCVVSGSEIEIFGTAWDMDNDKNKMTKDSDGNYSITYTVKKAYDIVYIAVYDGETEKMILDPNGYNIEFSLTGPGSFTVTYDPKTGKVSVTGSIVKKVEFKYKTVTAAGNGVGNLNWLNDSSWDPECAANDMTEVKPGVYKITFKNVAAKEGFEYQVKFALDHSWTFNFGAVGSTVTGTWTEAEFNGHNIIFDLKENTDVTLYLDLTEFDYTTRKGAKYALFLGEDPVVFDNDKLNGPFTIEATSNLFPTKTAEYSDLSKLKDENGDVFITVEWKMKAAGKYLVNLDIDELTWDNTVLEFKEAYNKFGEGKKARFGLCQFAYEQGIGGEMINTFGDVNGGRIVGNYTSVSPVARAYSGDGEKIVVVRAVFKVLKPAEKTTVNLKMDTISLCDNTSDKPYAQYAPVSGCEVNGEHKDLAEYETVIKPSDDNDNDKLNGPFTIEATSNLFPTKTAEYSDLSKLKDENGDVFITVEWKMKAAGKYLVNLDIDELTWDNTVLEFKEAYNKFGEGKKARFGLCQFAYEQGIGGEMINTFGDVNGGRIVGNYTSVSPVARAYSGDGEKIVVVRAVFKVLKPAEKTTVNLKMDTISLCDNTSDKPYAQYAPVSGCEVNGEHKDLAEYETVIKPSDDKGKPLTEEEVAALVDKIPDPDKITPEDKDKIKEAIEEYNKLSDEDKAKLPQETVDKLIVADTTVDILALPDPGKITLDDKDAIEAAKKKYDDLTDEQKKLIPPEVLQKLEAAEKALKKLEGGSDVGPLGIPTWIFVIIVVLLAVIVILLVVLIIVIAMRNKSDKKEKIAAPQAPEIPAEKKE